MSVGESSGPIHPVPTQNSGYRCLFYDKHHGRGGPDASQWLASLSRDDEFAVFDVADREDLKDERGWLYGVRPRDTAGRLPDLGTCGQQIAEFPLARLIDPWHGYPLWPLGENGPENRKGEKGRPSKVVFLRMEAVGLLTARERKRSHKGNHV
jgi:hypothetical protein